jgi:zinc D-Ala-D-Ala carboxypeptidase
MFIKEILNLFSKDDCNKVSAPTLNTHSNMLSKNFSLDELTKSQTALRLGIDNTPSLSHKKSLKMLCIHVLEPCRKHFARSITPSSGYRSKELCNAIGSKATSQHAKGQAVDFEVAGVSNLELAEWIRDNLEFDQLILEFHNPDDPNSGWVHCSYRADGKNRNQFLSYDGKRYTKIK